MLRVQRWIGFSAAAIALWGAATGCGSSGGKADSYASITDEISQPTGTVSEATVAKVGEKFETASSNTFMGRRDEDQVGASVSGSSTQSCPSGGSVSGSGSGSESQGHVAMHFDRCCFTEGCCASGSGNIFYSSDQTAAYNTCASFDMDFSCRGTSGTVDYASCVSTAGKTVVLINVDGSSYVVSGTRSGGTGSLEIRGANGTWSCSFTTGSGSCSSSTGASFSFTAAAG